MFSLKEPDLTIYKQKTMTNEEKQAIELATTFEFLAALNAHLFMQSREHGLLLQGFTFEQAFTAYRIRNAGGELSEQTVNLVESNVMLIQAERDQSGPHCYFCGDANSLSFTESLRRHFCSNDACQAELKPLLG